MNERHIVNIVQAYRPAQVGIGLSWLATAVVALPCLFLALVLGHALEPFGALFRGLEVEVPWPTRFLLATQGWPLRLIFLGLAVFVIWKEFSIQELRRKFVLTARIFFAALLTMALFMLTVYLPVFMLASKLAK
jgi:hypothetical protein